MDEAGWGGQLLAEVFLNVPLMNGRVNSIETVRVGPQRAWGKWNESRP